MYINGAVFGQPARTELPIEGYIRIFSSEAWAQAALTAPSMGHTNTHFQGGWSPVPAPNYAVGNVAFWSLVYPHPLEEIIHSFLVYSFTDNPEGITPVTPRPFLSVTQRQLAGRLRAASGGTPTNPNQYWVTPDLLQISVGAGANEVFVIMMSTNEGAEVLFQNARSYGLIRPNAATPVTRVQNFVLIGTQVGINAFMVHLEAEGITP